MLVSVGLTGCRKTVTLFLIKDYDLVSMKAGKPYAPEVDGWFISDFWLKKVADAKVE